LLWSLGAVGPVAGAVADRIGWGATLVGALTGSLLALPLSLVGTLPAVVASLAVLTVAMFTGATAAQIGVATASESDQGSASAIYYSCYYACGAFAGYLPGVAWQWWSHRRRSWGIGAGRGHLAVCTSRSRASPEALARIILSALVSSVVIIYR
jgi:hypothetical protein